LPKTVIKFLEGAGYVGLEGELGIKRDVQILSFLSPGYILIEEFDWTYRAAKVTQASGK
jgi:hypothetical protein